MRKILLLLFITGVTGVNALAHTAFTLVSSEKKSLTDAELAQLEKTRTIGKIVGSNISFTEKEIRLVVQTGPEDDMLSYRIQGVRNPNLVVPAGATLKILFVNMDSDMRHDVRFGHVIGEFGVTPDVTETAGSTKLNGYGEGTVNEAEEIVLRANEDGAYKYFCSVRNHAKGGMWGNIFVGVKPGDKVKMAEKKHHVHSADEDEDDHDHPAPSATPSPTPKKPEERR
jgi:plastocyanin